VAERETTVSAHPNAELVGDAMKMAGAAHGGRALIDGVIFHSDYAADLLTQQTIS